MTAPYYSDDQITIYHGDCREILPTLEPVDLILTDPPYGIGYQSNNRVEQFALIVGDDTPNVCVEGLAAALKVLRKNRHLYAFGRYDFSSLPLADSVELIWDKGGLGKGNLSITFSTTHEYIQFAAYVPSKANRKRGDGRLAARMRRGSVLKYPRITAGANKRHPTEKPVPLLRELIESSSLFGETVLDPFMGVGSTLIAASLEGRKAIGIEIEEQYCEVAVQRLRTFHDAT